MTTFFDDLRNTAFETLKIRLDQQQVDRDRTRAERIEFEQAYGHIERRHREVWIVLTILKVLTCAIAGLFVAMGLNAFACLIVAIVVWRAASGVTERHELEDTIRRGAAGVD